MKSNTIKITLLIAINQNGYTQKVNHVPMNYVDDGEPLLLRTEAQKGLPLQEDAYYVMDMHTYECMKENIPTDKIILWGVTANDYAKYYSDKHCFKTCVNIQELRELEKNVYCMGIKQNFIAFFLKYADEMIIVRIDNKEEWSTEESIPKISESSQALVWDTRPVMRHANYQVEHSVRRDEWREKVAEAKLLFAQLFTAPEQLAMKRQQILDCITMMNASYFSYYAIIQHLLGERFTEVYKSYEAAISTEYLEYAPSASFKLSGTSQQKKIFTGSFIEWFNKGFCAKIIDSNTFKRCVERVYDMQDPKDILHGDRSKDLSSHEIENIVESVFIALGCTPEKQTVAA